MKMSKGLDHSLFLSPFTWRYASIKMREIFSEEHKRRVLRSIWIALAQAHQQAGLVTQEQVDDLIAHQYDIDIDRASEIEREIHHDLMAEIKTYAEQCPIGGSIIHLGATSMDVLDNMDVMRQKEAFSLIISLVEEILLALKKQMEKHKETLCMAFTHIQPAEPTTLGYRFAQIAQDLLDDLEDLRRISSQLKGKGLKGAVGTGASYSALLEDNEMSSLELERLVMEKLDLEPFVAATQVYPRKQDWRVASVLAGLSATINTFALDMRVMQSPPFGEWSEPFGKKQVGSSAMPFKRNPINSEKINSLARFVKAQVDVLWDNASLMILERTLDDSANRRVVIPEIFLATEEILTTTLRLVQEMNIHTYAIERNVESYGVFAASERLLMHLGKQGANRQTMHEVIREHSLKAWSEVQQGKSNNLSTYLAEDPRILEYLTEKEILSLLSVDGYTGDASYKTDQMIEAIQKAVSKR
jgi:adenylosuccinate lyase